MSSVKFDIVDYTELFSLIMLSRIPRLYIFVFESKNKTIHLQGFAMPVLDSNLHFYGKRVMQ